MEESSNFIPLGIPKGNLPFDKPSKSVRPVRVEGKTPGERKQIAREIRNSLKKEKKLAKADAKKQRKQNAIMHRRMTKNPEKYHKHKDRNRTRALEAERNKIRLAAVYQAERLAAKHDPSGKKFNVGEVVVLEDGSVRSKEALANVAARKAEREAEKATKEAGASINPERAGQIQGVAEETPKKSPHVSKKQQKKQAALAPRPPPPQPVLPEGINIPEGEENFITMWDITDEEIAKRMNTEKRAKSMERKFLRRRQKEEKTFNRAMKLLKKQTENRGETWDPVKGKAIVLMEQAKEELKEDSQESGSEDDSEYVDSEAEKAAETAEEPEPPSIEKVFKKSKMSKKYLETSINGAASDDPNGEKNLKLSTEKDLLEEPKAKKSKKSKESKLGNVEEADAPGPVEVEPEAATTEKKKKKKKDKGESSNPSIERSSEENTRAEKKSARREKKRLEKEAAAAAEIAKANAAYKEATKKRKRSEDETEVLEKEKPHKKKAKSNEKSTNGSAEQWNPEALTGDAARKEKFLRLLGAGKTNGSAANGSKHKSNAKLEDIVKVQSELERQYEAGMKMKHDGGAKRRGLGA